jgi:hypothetical protein
MTRRHAGAEKRHANRTEKLPISYLFTYFPQPLGETVPNMGVIMLPREMSGDAGSFCGDPPQASR